jgi:hypothetical protein
MFFPPMSRIYLFWIIIIIIYPCPFVHPSRYRYMVCLTLPSYRFRATSMIFCRCLYTWRCAKKWEKREWKGRKMDLGPPAQLLEIGSLWLLFLRSYSSKCLLDTLSVSINYSTNLCSLWNLEGPLNANLLYKYCKLQAKRICTRKDSKFISLRNWKQPA